MGVEHEDEGRRSSLSGGWSFSGPSSTLHMRQWAPPSTMSSGSQAEGTVVGGHPPMRGKAPAAHEPTDVHGAAPRPSHADPVPGPRPLVQSTIPREVPPTQARQEQLAGLASMMGGLAAGHALPNLPAASAPAPAPPSMPMQKQPPPVPPQPPAANRWREPGQPRFSAPIGRHAAPPEASPPAPVLPGGVRQSSNLPPLRMVFVAFVLPVLVLLGFGLASFEGDQSSPEVDEAPIIQVDEGEVGPDQVAGDFGTFTVPEGWSVNQAEAELVSLAKAEDPMLNIQVQTMPLEAEGLEQGCQLRIGMLVEDPATKLPSVPTIKGEPTMGWTSTGPTDQVVQVWCSVTDETMTTIEGYGETTTQGQLQSAMRSVAGSLS